MTTQTNKIQDIRKVSMDLLKDYACEDADITLRRILYPLPICFVCADFQCNFSSYKRTKH